MTYYEEFGLAQTASVEEIRHAYRRLARLVHPDQCGDAESRHLAELQMIRLNGVLAVLTDHEQRDRYDASLITAIGDPRDVAPRHRRAIYAGAVVLALVGITAALWPKRPPVTSAATTPVAPIVEITQSKKNARLPQPVATMRPRPTVEIAEAPEIPTPIPSIQAVPLPTMVPPTLPVTPPVETAVPIAAVAPRLTGRWLFVATRATQHAGYPPEYIELRLSETGDMLRGLYQARYRVTDRAISPNVAFRFEGPSSPDGGVLPWQGPDGSKGEVTLRLLPTGGLEVGWVAQQLGQELGLISGAATLVRKIE